MCIRSLLKGVLKGFLGFNKLQSLNPHSISYVWIEFEVRYRNSENYSDSCELPLKPER